VQLFVGVLVNLALTIAVEALVVALITRTRRVIYYSTLCNLATNQALNLLVILAILLWGEDVYAPMVAALEVAAILVEAQIYHVLTSYTFARSLALSIAANAASFLVGLLLFS
jgi:hypothetical protein